MPPRPKSSHEAFALQGVAVLAAILVAALPSPLGAQGGTCPDPAALVGHLDAPFAHVRYLADDALGGREVATPGARCAADYLAGELEALGLEPGAEDGTYFQTFPVRAGATLGSDNALTAASERYRPEAEWIPFGFSAAGEVSARLVYGSHGLSRPGEAADSSIHRNVEGRLLVLESGDPASPGGRSVHADPHFKATVAAGRGAAGLVILLPEGAPLPDPSDEVRGPVEIPVAAAAGAAAVEIRQAARRGEAATLRTDVSPRNARARNVAAVLRGSDPARENEWLVVGAHYDHLGLGGEGSLAPDDEGTVHNGADDNASGTAVLLEVARRLSRGDRPRRSVLFLAFTGEEKGLWGSSHYVRDPLRPLERTVAMLNLDMVGRLGDGPLTVYGTGTAEEWPDLLEGATRSLDRPLALNQVPDGFGPSDHSVFHARGLPVLHFFTNTHPDYHRPGDDWQKIDEEGLTRVADLVTEVSRRLAGEPGRSVAELTPSASPNPHAGPVTGEPGQPSGDPGRGYGPYLGTIPDMTPTSGGGVRLTGVREESPAERAGIQGGDVVVEFEDRSIGDLYDYTYALRAQEVGDTVRIVVEREGDRVELTAVLGQRR